MNCKSLLLFALLFTTTIYGNFAKGAEFKTVHIVDIEFSFQLPNGHFGANYVISEGHVLRYTGTICSTDPKMYNMLGFGAEDSEHMSFSETQNLYALVFPNYESCRKLFDLTESLKDRKGRLSVPVVLTLRTDAAGLKDIPNPGAKRTGVIVDMQVMK